MHSKYSFVLKLRCCENNVHVRQEAWRNSKTSLELADTAPSGLPEAPLARTMVYCILILGNPYPKW